MCVGSGAAPGAAARLHEREVVPHKVDVARAVEDAGADPFLLKVVDGRDELHGHWRQGKVRRKVRCGRTPKGERVQFCPGGGVRAGVRRVWWRRRDPNGRICSGVVNRPRATQHAPV